MAATASNTRNLASYDLNTEDGFREFSKEVHRRAKDLTDVLNLASDTTSKRLEKTPTHGDVNANARAEARKIRRNLRLAALSATFMARSVTKAFRIFEDKFVARLSDAGKGMKMNDTRRAA